VIHRGALAVALLLAAPQDDPGRRARDLIEKLGSDRVERREEAFRELRRLSLEARPELDRAAADPDPEVAAKVREVLRIFELRSRISARLRAAVPGVEDRLAAGAWVGVLLEAADPERRRGPVEREDLEFLAGPALARAAGREERERVAEVVILRRLRSAVPALLSLVAEGDDGSRRIALQALAELDAREAAPRVSELFRDGRPAVRSAALELLGELDAREESAAVLALLEDPEAEVRAEAINLLKEFRGREAAAEIRKRLRDSDEGVRLAAAGALVGLDVREAAADLAALLRDPHPAVRSGVIRMADYALGPQAAPAADALLGDPEAEVRLAAVRHHRYGSARLPEARARELLEDPSEEVRAETLAALVAARDPAALPEILARLRSGEAERRLEGLKLFWSPAPADGRAEARRLLRDPDAAVRALAASVVAEVEGKEAAPALLALLGDGNAEVVLASAQTLARLEAREALPALLGRFRDATFGPRQNLLPPIVRLQGKEAGPLLLRSLEDESPPVRGVAAELARGFGVGLLFPELTGLLRSPRPEVRRSALEASGGLPDAEAARVAEGLLDDPDPGVRREAASRILWYGSPVHAARVRPYLADADPEFRAQAARALAGWGDRESVAGIRALLRDPENEVRGAAILALLALGAKDSAPEIREFLGASDRDLRGAALVALEEWGIPIPEADRLDPERFGGDGFFLYLPDEERRHGRARILGALHRLGSPGALRDLASRLEWTDRVPAGGAERILRGAGVEMVLPGVVAGLSDPDPRARTQALDALGILAGRTQAAQLARLLSDPHPGVRTAAAEVLAEVEASEHAREIAVLLDDRYEEVRAVAAAALGHLRAKAFLPGLRKSLRDPEPAVVHAAIGALARLGDAEAIPGLVALLDVEDPSMRSAALRALGDLGAAGALGRIRSLLREDDAIEVREAAARALAALGSRDEAETVSRTLEELDRGRKSTFICGGIRAHVRTPPPWRDRREAPHPFNALRCPDLWDRLRKTPLGADLEGSGAELARALAERAGIEVELPPDPDADGGWSPAPRRIPGRDGRTSLLEAVASLAPGDYELVLEPGRVRILRPGDGLAFWVAWWKAEAGKK